MAIIDLVKFDGLKSRDWIVYKHYAEDLSTATQLIVSEGQVAVLLKGGRLFDMFGPGRHTLSTENLPLLRGFIKLPFGGRTPFTAEIYYINTTAKLDLTWGTSDPIQLVDPAYHIRLRIRAFGSVGLKISDYAVFLRELIGTMNASEVISYDRTLEFFKGFLVTKVKSVIAKVIIDEKISALEISAKLNDLSDKVASMLEPDFDTFGMKLINFYIKSINFPDEDFDKINNILAQKAEFDIMGDSRYATKRAFDVYEGAANNESGVAGVFAAGGMGVASGIAMYNGINGNGLMGAAPMNPAAQTMTVCGNCGAQNPAGTNFCNQCGNRLGRKMTVCPNCGKENEESAVFCNNCGTKIKTEPRVCECGQPIAPGSKFCSGCGKKVDE